MVNRGIRRYTTARKKRLMPYKIFDRRVQRLRRAGAPSYLNKRTGGFLGIESKFIDSTYTDAIVTSIAGAEADPPGAGAQTSPGSISGIAQGDGESNRDGRKCTLTSVHVRGSVTRDSASAMTNAAVIRVVLVQDTQTNGVQLSAENVFVDSGNVEHQWRNLQFSKRFKVLKDQTFIVQPPAAGGNGTSNDAGAGIRTFKWNIPVNIPVIHNGTTVAITNVTDNSLHMLAWSSDTLTTLKYQSRVRFVG